jgi:hypothetical protein
MASLTSYDPDQAKAVPARPYKQLVAGALFGLLSPKNRMTNQARKILEKYGEYVLGDIAVYRVPVNSAILGILNAASLGAIRKNMQKVGYDKLYHLYMVVQLKDRKEGHRYLLIEKNEIVNIEERSNLLAKHETLSAAKSPRLRLTLRQLFEETIQRVGSERFWGYSATNYNCQRFVLDLLETAYLGNVPPPLRQFVYQDKVREVVDSPQVSQLANEVTDIAGWFRGLLGAGASSSDEDDDEEEEQQQPPKKVVPAKKYPLIIPGRSTTDDPFESYRKTGKYPAIPTRTFRQLAKSLETNIAAKAARRHLAPQCRSL